MQSFSPQCARFLNLSARQWINFVSRPSGDKTDQQPEGGREGEVELQSNKQIIIEPAKEGISFSIYDSLLMFHKLHKLKTVSLFLLLFEH